MCWEVSPLDPVALPVYGSLMIHHLVTHFQPVYKCFHSFLTKLISVAMHYISWFLVCLVEVHFNIYSQSTLSFLMRFLSCIVRLMLLLAACLRKGKCSRAEWNHQQVVWKNCTVEPAQVRLKCSWKVLGIWWCCWKGNSHRGNYRADWGEWQSLGMSWCSCAEDNW